MEPETTHASIDADPHAPRGADEDEFNFLGSRAQSVPLGAATIREKLLAVGRSARSWDQTVVVTVYEEGEQLNTLYKRHADAVLGAASFRALLQERFPLGVDAAIERMEFAKYATRKQAEALKYTRLRFAVRLVKALGLASIGELANVDLRLPKEFGLATVRLMQATPDQLAAALRLLKAPTRDDAPGRTKGEELHATRSWIREQREADPQVDALEPTASLDDGEVTVRVVARGKEQARVAAKFYERLARRR